MVSLKLASRLDIFLQFYRLDLNKFLMIFYPICVIRETIATHLLLR